MAKKERVYKVEGKDFTTKTFAKKYGFKLATAYVRLVAYETDKNMKKLIAPVEREGSIVVGGKKLNHRKLMVIHKCKEWRARAIMGAWNRGIITERQALGKDVIESHVLKYSTSSVFDEKTMDVVDIDLGESFAKFEKMSPAERTKHNNKRKASISKIKVGSWEARNL